MGKKHFIDKKTARVFRLVDRSVATGDHDVDSDGNPLPDRVFAEITPGHDLEEGEDEFVDIGSEEANLAEVRAGEAAKYGILFDDRQYDYTQHLKPIGQAPGAKFFPAPGATLEHNNDGELPSETADPLVAEAAALNAATYERIGETDADPAVLEVLEALEDDAFIDEDEFEDDFIVKLDREEVRVLAPVESFIKKSAGKKSKDAADLDKDFEKILQMYSDDDFEESYYESCNESGEYSEHYEEYSEDSDEDGTVVVDLDDAIPFSRGGPSRMYQLDEVRRELRDGSQALLDRILYTSESEEEGKVKAEIIQLEEDPLQGLNCVTACEFLRGSQRIVRPRLIVETAGEARVKPVRISRKTGAPIAESPVCDEEGEESLVRENKGKARPKEESPEEKKARKAAAKEERKLKRAAKKTFAV